MKEKRIYGMSYKAIAKFRFLQFGMYTGNYTGNSIGPMTLWTRILTIVNRAFKIGRISVRYWVNVFASLERILKSCHFLYISNHGVVNLSTCRNYHSGKTALLFIDDDPQTLLLLMPSPGSVFDTVHHSILFDRLFVVLVWNTRFLKLHLVTGAVCVEDNNQARSR